MEPALVTGRQTHPLQCQTNQRICALGSERRWQFTTSNEGEQRFARSEERRLISEGNLFFFTAHAGGADNIWVSRERILAGRVDGSKPVALTNGPGYWRWPVVSADNKEIFAIHSVTAPQLTSLDPATKEWRPFWHGAPVYEMDYSKAGQEVAFIQHPDHTLWKAKADGGERSS